MLPVLTWEFWFPPSFSWGFVSSMLATFLQSVPRFASQFKRWAAHTTTALPHPLVFSAAS